MHSGANGVPEETKSSNVTDTTQKRGSIQTRRGSMGAYNYSSLYSSLHAVAAWAMA